MMCLAFHLRFIRCRHVLYSEPGLWIRIPVQLIFHNSWAQRVRFLFLQSVFSTVRCETSRDLCSVRVALNLAVLGVMITNWWPYSSRFCFFHPMVVAIRSPKDSKCNFAAPGSAFWLFPVYYLRLAVIRFLSIFLLVSNFIVSEVLVPLLLDVVLILIYIIFVNCLLGVFFPQVEFAHSDLISVHVLIH